MKFSLITLCFLSLLSSCGNKNNSDGPSLGTQAQAIITDGTTTCINSLKQKMINREIGMQNESINEDDQFHLTYRETITKENAVKSFKVNKNDISDSVATSVSVGHSKDQMNLNYELRLNEGKLFLEVSLAGKKTNGIEFKYNKEYKVLEDCTLSYSSMNLVDLNRRRIQNGKFSIKSFYHNSLNETRSEEVFVERGVLSTDGLVQSPSTLNTTNTGRFLLYSSIDDPNVQTEVSIRAESIVRAYDVILEREVDMAKFSYIQSSSAMDITAEIYASTESGYILSKIVSPFTLYTLTLNETLFLSQSLGQTERVQLRNLTASSFGADSAGIRVETNYRANMALLENYFEVQDQDETGYTLKAKPIHVQDASYPLTSPAVEDGKYLAGSDMIEINHPTIQEWKAQVLAANPTRVTEVIAKTQEIINSAIQYNYSQLTNDLIRTQTIDEILSTNLGVCQHFALLSVTLLRALGIPARIAVGLAIGENSAVGHAWVEAKIDGVNWTPFEPQRLEQYFAIGLHYFPVGEFINYEVGNPLYNLSASDSGLYGILQEFTFIGL